MNNNFKNITENINLFLKKKLQIFENNLRLIKYLT